MTLAAIVLSALSSFAFEHPIMELPPFERAVLIIKHYETLHQPKHWPLIGYGHKVMPSEPYVKGIQLSEKEADVLLRKDLKKMCSMFRRYGSDSLLLGCLAYNVGPYRLLGDKAMPKSKLLKNIEENGTISSEDYLSYSNYKRRQHAGLLRRRYIEFKVLSKLSNSFNNEAKILNAEANDNVNILICNY